MLPEQLLSTVPIKGKYLSPDDIGTARVAYELGGVALNDPSQGLRVQVWKLEAVGNRVLISAPNTVRKLLFSGTDITEVSLAFDQNMRPFVSFMDGVHAKIWWYDTLTATQIFTELPSGSITPKACLDDKRSTQSASSDIIVAYIRADKLYFRVQRDRFLVEYLLQSGLDAKLERIGMTDKNRVQFKLVPNV